MTSVEQHVRNILSRAVNAGLVAESDQWDDPDPQSRTAGELVDVANYLALIIRGAEERGRYSAWRRTEGDHHA